MNKITLPKSLESLAKTVEPKFALINGGKQVVEKIGKDQYKSYRVMNVSPSGIMCDDLETFITWDKFN